MKYSLDARFHPLAIPSDQIVGPSSPSPRILWPLPSDDSGGLEGLATRYAKMATNHVAILGRLGHFAVGPPPIYVPALPRALVDHCLCCVVLPSLFSLGLYFAEMWPWRRYIEATALKRLGREPLAV